MLKKLFLVAVIGLDLFLLYWALGGQKADYMAQAAELQRKQEEGVRDYAKTLVADFETDAKLWQLAIELLDGPAERPEVIRKVKGWLPKAFTEEQGGFIQDVAFRKPDGTKADQWKVAWKKNSILLEFDAKGSLAQIDVSVLAGRGLKQVVDNENNESEPAGDGDSV